MALDLAKMRAKLQESESGGKKSDNAFWRPTEGDQEIRLVPTEDGDPFKVFHFHYNLGDNVRGGVLCPKRQFGDGCPVCEFASQLWQEGTDESKKMAKSLFVRQRFFSPVIVRGEEEAGVRIWGYGKTIYEALLGYVLNPDYGDITEVQTGVDFTLTYTLPKTKGAFPQTNLVPNASLLHLPLKERSRPFWIQFLMWMPCLLRKALPKFRRFWNRILILRAARWKQQVPPHLPGLMMPFGNYQRR